MESLRDVVVRLIGELGWNQSELADKVNLSKSQVSRLVGNNADATDTVAKDVLNRLAFAIVSEHWKRDPINGAARLEEVLHDLLAASGYHLGQADERNAIWRSFTTRVGLSRSPGSALGAARPKIRFGGIPWGSLYRTVDGQQPKGVLADIVRNVTALMDMEVEFLPILLWRQLLDGLTGRQIHFTTILHLPARETFVRFSSPIFEQPVPMGILVPSTRVNQQLETQDLLVCCVEGEVGEAVARRVLPGSTVDRIFSAAEDACRHVIQAASPPPAPTRFHDDRARCFVADIFVCREMCAKFDGQLELIERGDAALPVAFALPHGEEKLTKVLNQALRDLRRNQLIPNLPA